MSLQQIWIRMGVLSLMIIVFKCSCVFAYSGDMRSFVILFPGQLDADLSVKLRSIEVTRISTSNLYRDIAVGDKIGYVLRQQTNIVETFVGVVDKDYELVFQEEGISVYLGRQRVIDVLIRIREIELQNHIPDMINEKEDFNEWFNDLTVRDIRSRYERGLIREWVFKANSSGDTQKSGDTR